MTIDLIHEPEVGALIEKSRLFTRGAVLPVEDAHGGDINAAGGDLIRLELQDAASVACLKLFYGVLS